MVQTATGLAALAPLVSGLLVEHFSGQWSLATFAIAMAISAIMCVALPGLKNAETGGGNNDTVSHARE